MRLLRYVLLFPAFLLGARLAASDSDLQALQLRELRAAAPDLRVTMDRERGVVGHLAVAGGFLPPTRLHRGRGDPLQPALDFIDAHPGLFGGDSAMLGHATIARNALDARDGMRSVIWQQAIAGIPVHRGLLSAHLGRQGEVIAIGSHFVPDDALIPRQAALTALAQGTPRDGRGGLVAALRALGDQTADLQAVASDAVGAEARQRLTSPRLKGAAQAHLTWFPVTTVDLRLAWDIVLTSRQDGKMYEVVVGAGDGAVHERQCLTVDEQQAARTYGPAFAVAAAFNAAGGTHGSPAGAGTAPADLPADTISLLVFDQGSPTPMRPGWPTPDTAQPPPVARAQLTLASIDPTASPHGWMDATSGDTHGNNADAHTDLNNDDQPDLPRPHSSGTPPTFAFPCDLTQEPAAYRDAAVVNLFYWCNLCHDRFYGLGFTEAFGNFQDDNFGNGGAGGDAVQADAQDGGGANNANFSTPPDGAPGRMQMYTFTGSSPNRDGDLDAYIIIHEYTHGLSNRLVGGGVGGMFALQSGGMGEGWSDFMSLCLLTDPGELVTGTYPVGSYAFIGLVADNYYRGVRRFPYAVENGPVTGASQNPLTFIDLRSNPEVHAMGEVWCETLWEARANLIRKLGSVSAGNELIMRLVVAGMKLTPSLPTFLQARDALLQADAVITGGADQQELWRAFAKRGMGFGASTANSNSTADVVEAFDVPGDLRLTPADSIAGSGPPGGPFSHATTTYTVTNANPTQAIAWTAAADQPWLTIVPDAGTLAAGASAAVSVSFNDAATQLARGTYGATIAFTNTTDGSGGATRTAQLQVALNYRVSTVPITWIPPDTHTVLPLSDDSVSAAQALPFPVEFYGIAYNQLFVGSNGLIGFASSFGVNFLSNGALPDPNVPNAAIYAAWDDLNPGAGGSVRIGTVGTAPDRKVVVSWVDVPRFGDFSSRYTMQIVLSEGGTDILVNYLDVSPGAPSGSGIGATVGVENEVGDTARQFSVNTASLSNNMALRYSFTNHAPTVAVPAASSLDPVHGTTITTMTALGADDGGEGGLAYTWTVSGSAPAGVAFEANNGTNAAKACRATFSAAGTYQLLCTIVDPEGLAVSTAVAVHMTAPTLTIHATASPAIVSGRGGAAILQVLGAIDGGSEHDLVYTWRAVGSPPGLVSFSANASNAAKVTFANFAAVGPYELQVTIADGAGLTVSEGLVVTVLPVAPVVATAASASLDPVHGTATTVLSVLGADEGGEAGLAYTWTSLGEPPAIVTFDPVNGSNAGKSCAATFSAPGTYRFRCTITDGDGLSVTSDVTVRMLAPTIAVHARANPILIDGRTGSATLSVLGAIKVGGEGELLYAWRVLGTPPGPVTLGASGSNASKVVGALFTALGHYDLEVTVTDGTGLAITDTVGVDVGNSAPRVATPASATPDPVTGTTTTLAILGSDDADESTLTYTWTAAPGSPAAVQFSPNAGNDAKHATATFTKAGNYTLMCTVTDGDGLSVTSTVVLVVIPTATTIVVAPESIVVPPGGSVVFAITAQDQFSQPMTAPTCTWTVDSTASGDIDAVSGRFAATVVQGGPYAVTATSGALTASATLSVVTPTTTSSGGSSGRSCGVGSGLAALVSMLIALVLMGWRRRTDG